MSASDNLTTGLQVNPKVARIRLVSMGVAYAMGTFNDNFFKQAVLLLAVTAGLHTLQGVATFLFALPFVLFSAWTGWLADRLPKKDIVVISKFLELAAMLLGLWALLTLNWAGIVGIVFLMGLQSTCFSPALNGAIPENFPTGEVPKVNAYLKLATTVTILSGIALGGIALDLPLPDFATAFVPEGDYAFGRLAVGVFAALISVIGIVAAFGIYKTPFIKRSGNPFPLFGPVDSVRHALECRRLDPPLFLVLSGEAFFYGLSSFVILVINNFGVNQLGFSLTLTGLLSVGLMTGICIGSLMAGRYDASSWRRIMIPAGAGMAISLLIAALAPLLPGTVACFFFLIVIFIITGICGGFYLIPVVSFIQIRPKATEKGKILGISNFASFSGIIISGIVFAISGKMSPALLLIAGSAVCLSFTAWAASFLRHLPDASLAVKAKSPFSLLLRILLSLRYRITITGMTDIPAHVSNKKPVLFMPNHPALIDPLIIYAILAGLEPRPLADEHQMKSPFGAFAAKLARPIFIPDPGEGTIAAKRRAVESMRTVTKTLQDGVPVLFYPAGRVYRSSREMLGANSGVVHLIRDVPDLRIILIRITGLWGSSFSYATKDGTPDFGKSFLRGMFTLAANLFLFTPRREVRIEFTEHPDLPRNCDKKTLNSRLEDFYNEVEHPPVVVPRFFWQRSAPQKQ
jgi:1-acyl-sn-glycerol-3-phosphate acyltransferase